MVNPMVLALSSLICMLRVDLNLVLVSEDTTMALKTTLNFYCLSNSWIDSLILSVVTFTG